MTQLPLAFADPIIAALTSRTISITTWEGLACHVKAASAQQLEEALAILPDELQRSRAPVLEQALRDRRRASI